MFNLCVYHNAIAKTADSFPGVALSLNNNESSNNCHSANVLVLLIAALCGCNLSAKYKTHP